MTGPRILCVEDHPEQAALLRNLLRHLPARVEVAETGDAAVAALTADPGDDPYQLLVLDMWVPQKSPDDERDTEAGLKLLLNLQRGYFRTDPVTPVVIFTAYEGYELCNECLRAGADYFLPKTDLRTSQNSYDRLSEVCGELLAHRPDPLRLWLDRELEALRDAYAGRFVAVVEPSRGEYRVALAADTLEAARAMVLANHDALWSKPRIFNIPQREYAGR